MANLDPNLEQTFNSLEEEHNLPNGLLKAVAYTESRYNPAAKSPVGASGMFQFMPATAQQYKVNVDDPVSSAQGAAKMYADLLKANNGDLDRALAGYNWGQGNLNKKGLENAPKETKNYINQITQIMSGQKKNINIPPEAMQAYNSYVKSQQGQSKMATNDIPPEALEAYNSYVAQNTQQAAPAQSDIPPEAMEAYNAYVSQNTQQPVQVQTPVQTAQSNAAFGIVNSQDNLNAQAANINAQQSQNQQGNYINNIFNNIISKSNNGEDITPLWNSLNPKEKKAVGLYLKDAYDNDPNVEKRGVISNLFQGLANSVVKSGDAIEQMGNYALSKATGNDKYINEKNAQIAKRNAANEINNAMDPSIARSVGEIGGDILQYASGEGLIKAGMTAAQRAVPGLIIKGGTAGARAADLAATGAGAAVLQNPTNPNSDNFVSDKLTQAATGAALGAGLGGAAEYAVGKVGGQIGKINEARKKPYSAADQEFIDQMESAGIRYTAADLPSANANLIEKSNKLTATNKDMNKFVKGQQEDLTKAVKTTLDDTKPLSTSIDDTAAKKALTDAQDHLNTLTTPSQVKKMKSVVDDIESTIGKINGGANTPSDISRFYNELNRSSKQAEKQGNIEGARFYNDLKTSINKDAVIQDIKDSLSKNVFDKDGNIVPKKLLENYKAYETNPSQTPLSQILDASSKKTLDNLMNNMSKLTNIGIKEQKVKNGNILDNVGNILRIKSLGGLPLVKPVYNFIQSKTFVKGLTDDKVKRFLVNLNNINPNKPKYAETFGQLSAYLSENYNDKINEKK